MTARDEVTTAPILVRGDAKLADVVPWYLDKRRQDVTAIREALAAGDFLTIRFLGHAMAGTGESFGFAALTDLGRALEKSAEDNDVQAVEQWRRRLACYLESLRSP